MKKFINIFIVLVAVFGFPLSFLFNSTDSDGLNALAGFLQLATWFAIAWVITKVYKKIKSWFYKDKNNL
jgi:hypothetical protein